MSRPYTKQGSIPYKDAGRRMRLSLDRLRDATHDGRPFPPVAWKVAMAAWALTASWSKAWDETYVAAIADMAGTSRQNASTWLPRLNDAGVLKWRPTKWNRASSLVGLPDEDMSRNEDMSGASHVSKRARNGLGAETLPSNPVSSAASPPRKCGVCGGTTTVALFDGVRVATCDSGCHYSVPV
jgi:hypothetical protein